MPQVAGGYTLVDRFPREGVLGPVPLFLCIPCDVARRKARREQEEAAKCE